ncbi:MAG: protoporphyrinogen oxidase [Candidatus Methylacidiphilales bacterium]|nr:protoporphyrinogen oxidase [Candidatus Methylacidiphilales bacterium]
MKKAKRVAILGAGISGLAAAWKLRQLGAEVTVYDPSPEPGGVIRTLRHEGYLLELGPNTVLEKGGALAELIEGCGLRGEVLSPLPQARKRFIYHGGGPVAAPSGPLSFLTSPLLGVPGKVRLLSEPFREPGTAGDESVAAFFSRRLGVEAVERLIDPFISGIYAGDPVRLSARFGFPKLWAWEREQGSLLKGALRGRKAPGPRVRARMLSFRQGLSALPARLAAELASSWRREAANGIASSGPGWRVNGEGPHDALVSTLPPRSLVPLLREGFPGEAPRALESYPHSSVRVWHFGVERRRVRHPLDGFGVLAPSAEEQPILGILFSSSIFAGRAPEGRVLLTVFQGGVRHPEWCLPDAGSEPSAQAAAWGAVCRWLGIDGGPDMVHHHLWNPAIPQYEVGHQTRLDALDRLEAAHPGLFLGGNLRGGVSVSDCVASSFQLAERVMAAS